MNEVTGFVEMFWPFLVLVAVFYFFMYRPQKKQERERNEFLQALKKGDHVVTAGGIYGVLRSVRNDVVTVEIAPKVVITMDKASIMRSAAKSADEKPAEKPEKADKPAEEETEPSADSGEKD